MSTRSSQLSWRGLRKKYESSPGPIDAQERRRSGVPEQVRRPSPRIEAARTRAPTDDLRVPVKIAQEQLGHASISTTLNIYTHVVDGSQRRAIEQLEARLFRTGQVVESKETPPSASARKEARE